MGREIRHRPIEIMEMQPINTAPKDGSYIILWGDSGFSGTTLRCTVGKYISSYKHSPWRDYGNDAFTDTGSEPTHWSPLPSDEKTQHQIALEGLKSHLQIMINQGEIMHKMDVQHALGICTRALDKSSYFYDPN